MMEELGSGFYLAMQDLEIRGAGEVLGDSQSGEIQQVGVSLYTEMLKRAVRDLQQGKEPDLSQPLDVVSEINLHAPALLPSDYCSDVQERLTLYKRLANCEADDDLLALQEELIDRFGEMPAQARTLLETHRLRMLVKPYGVQKLDASESQITVQFGKDAAIDPVKVIMLIQKDKSTRMSGPDKLIRKIVTPELKERVAAVKTLLDAVKA
jgi:transcription-repair coupling factor (superfamily II helicase)